MAKGKIIPCSQCSKERYYYPRDLRRENKHGYFCSSRCKGVWFRGKRLSPATEFKKGSIPWTTGKHLRLNPKGEFKKGMIPWNKNLTGLQMAWNRGIKSYSRRIRVIPDKVANRVTTGNCCRVCHKIYWILRSRQLKDFCSKKCKTEDSRLKRLKNCKYCGKQFNRLFHPNKKFCSKDCQCSWQSTLVGTKSPSWRGGIKKDSDRRKSIEGMRWKWSVFKRDNYTCQQCGQYRGKIEAHHLKPYCNYIDLRYELSNGLTLCHDCHKKTENYGAKARRFKPTNTS